MDLIAITIDKDYSNEDYSLIDYLLGNQDKYKIGEIILHCNGLDLSDKYEGKCTLIINDIPSDLVRVYRQIISYVSQSYNSGRLFICRLGDKFNLDTLVNSSQFTELMVYTGLIKSNEFIYTDKVYDLFILSNPFGFITKINLTQINELRFKSLYEYFSKLLKLSTIKECDINYSKSELSLIKAKYGFELINCDEFKNTLCMYNLIKFLYDKSNTI